MLGSKIFTLAPKSGCPPASAKLTGSACSGGRPGRGHAEHGQQDDDAAQKSAPQPSDAGGVRAWCPVERLGERHCLSSVSRVGVYAPLLTRGPYAGGVVRHGIFVLTPAVIDREVDSRISVEKPFRARAFDTRPRERPDTELRSRWNAVSYTHLTLPTKRIV